VPDGEDSLGVIGGGLAEGGFGGHVASPPGW
jgi:hypothetical protein